MEDSEVSVDDLAAEMNLSRVQLYRKIKAITGSSPVELLRTTRLKRAYQMLLTTDKSVREVAYAVGFTKSPATSPNVSKRSTAWCLATSGNSHGKMVGILKTIRSFHCNLCYIATIFEWDER